MKALLRIAIGVLLSPLLLAMLIIMPVAMFLVCIIEFVVTGDWEWEEQKRFMLEMIRGV